MSQLLPSTLRYSLGPLLVELPVEWRKIGVEFVAGEKRLTLVSETPWRSSESPRQKAEEAEQCVVLTIEESKRGRTSGIRHVRKPGLETWDFEATIISHDHDGEVDDEGISTGWPPATWSSMRFLSFETAQSSGQIDYETDDYATQREAQRSVRPAAPVFDELRNDAATGFATSSSERLWLGGVSTVFLASLAFHDTMIYHRDGLLRIECVPLNPTAPSSTPLAQLLATTNTFGLGQLPALLQAGQELRFQSPGFTHGRLDATVAGTNWGSGDPSPRTLFVSGPRDGNFDFAFFVANIPLPGIPCVRTPAMDQAAAQLELALRARSARP